MWFVNAIDKGGESNDNLTKARTLVAQSTIYYSLMKWDKVYDVSIEAANYYFELGRINNYILSLLRCIGGCLQNNNYDKAKELLDKCYQHIENLPESIVSEIYSYNLLYLSNSDDAEVVRRVINEYIGRVADNKVDYLTIAGAYTDIGAYDEAESTLQKIDVNTFNDDYRVLKYYATLLKIYEHKGDFKSAYEAYIKFNELNDKIVFSIFESDTQFIVEKYALELQNTKEKENRQKIIIIGIALVSILITIVIYIRGRLKYRTIQKAHAEQETERYRLLYEQMEYEKDNLSELLSHNNDLDNNIRHIIAQRIELLNKFFTVYITNNSEISRKVDKELDELLANKSLFMSSTRLAFAGSHPKFIKYLEEHNLSEQEIEICCLYAIGLKGKDIKAYTNQSRHYHQSADIRHKLGLTESDTNLSIFLRDMLEK
jgi:tetratricopeptide (TPR) repeat protein